MIGKNIKRLLNQQGISQREFAKTIGITEATLSRYINGTRVPKATMLIKIADGLGVTTDQLLSKDDPLSSFDRFRVRVYKYSFSKKLEEMLKEINGKGYKTEFLQYAKREIVKMMNRVNTDYEN